MITGGAGFVGSHLADRLVDDDWDVLAIDDLSRGKVSRLSEARRHGSVAFHQVDIRSEELLDVSTKFSPEVIFHLAAQASVATSVKDPVLDADINILGTLNVIEAARRAESQRVVFVSTGGAVYGSKVKLPARESYIKRPDSPYGISKKAVEDYFRFSKETWGVDFAIIGPANVYGPRQDPFGEAGVVAIFSRACLDRTPPTIFGTGTDTRDYVYVEDVVDAHRASQRHRWRVVLQCRNRRGNEHEPGLRDDCQVCEIRRRSRVRATSAGGYSPARCSIGPSPTRSWAGSLSPRSTKASAEQSNGSRLILDQFGYAEQSREAAKLPSREARALGLFEVPGRLLADG